MLNEPARRFSWNAYSEKTQFRFIREVKASLRFLWSSMDFRKIPFSNHFGFFTLLYLGGVSLIDHVLEHFLLFSWIAYNYFEIVS